MLFLYKGLCAITPKKCINASLHQNGVFAVAQLVTVIHTALENLGDSNFETDIEVSVSNSNYLKFS